MPLLSSPNADVSVSHANRRPRTSAPLSPLDLSKSKLASQPSQPALPPSPTDSCASSSPVVRPPFRDPYSNPWTRIWLLLEVSLGLSMMQEWEKGFFGELSSTFQL
ncbi:hypothetical protein CALVIDRAFT_268582 [Calocera viscosa TUFC12733]|uniref:Uncharacterized protein n=1 Tax=Calocera viscosa (strain TUFC12733) TaxID=1330018 RepID=A0A167J0S0_CALVF|nr:hypothetical protein CALVIDRAFT_268582 [Calocera viscosa TUFC12733]